MPYIAPAYELSAFNCPHCGAYAKQYWSNLFFKNSIGQKFEVEESNIAFCEHCNSASFWLHDKMIAPDSTSVPIPNEDMPEEIKIDYLEASSILTRSPRGAAALLRLAIQKLCVLVGEKGKNINDDIGQLVKKGLPVKVQQALDVLRVVGNNAVHPGQIDLKDNHALAVPLFNLINVIVDVMITQPKHINDLYGSLPENLLEAIEKRDAKE
jgi:hypothetical protein